MLLVDPKSIVFEDRDDIINYVSKGLPPTKKNFKKVMAACSDPIDEELNTYSPDDVVIPKELMLSIDREEFISVMQKVYENNCRNRNIIIGIAGALLVGFVAKKIASHAKEKKEIAEIDTEIANYIAEHPNVQVERF